MERMLDAILELAVEDFYGLWEILWRFQTLQPQVPTKEAIQGASAAVAALYSEGLIEFFFRTDRGEEPIPAGQVPEVISPESRYWDVPQDLVKHVVVASTSKGELVYDSPTKKA